MKLRLTLLCSFLAGSVSFAQVVVPRLAIERVDDPSLDTYTFGAAECNDTLTVRWSNTLSTLATICSANPLKIWSTEGECGNEAATGDVHYDEVPSTTLNTLRQGTFTVKIAELPGFASAGTVDGGTTLPCGDLTPFTKIHRVCGSVQYTISTGVGCGTPQFQTATPLKLVYDTEPPSAPEITDSSPQDEAVRVGFTVDSDTTVVMLEVKGPDDADFRQIADTASTSTSIRGDGLQNNVPYQVRVRGADAAGNVSLPSSEITISPIHTLGFYGFYRNAGGTEQGGCSVGAGLMPLLLAAWAFRRARKQVRRLS